MSTSPRTAYRSTTPEVRAAWADTQERYRSLHAAIGAFEKEFPNHLALTLKGDSRYRLYGLRGKESPGDLWRQDRKGDWVPNKRTKAGKELAARVDNLRAEKLGVLPGMPATAMEDMTFAHPGVREIDGVVWATWSVGPEAVEGGDWGPKVDFGLWERANLSAYYLAVESAPVEEAS